MSLRAQIEAILYVAEEPVTVAQLQAAVGVENPKEITAALAALIADSREDSRGVEIKEVAGGYKMATKPEHHEAVRQFVRLLKPPIKLSLPALETLSVIAYRQPVTLPEIQEVRGVDASGVVRTLLEKKLITTSGRKNVIGRPILYSTTRNFLVQFGLKDTSELPSLKEFEELSRSTFSAE